MFFGEFEYRIDEKGRVPLPPKFRKELANGVVLTPGMEKCIVAYPVAEWKKLADNLTKGSVSPSKLRRLNRAIFATAYSMYADGQGRIALPTPLREYADIRDEVVIIGDNTYLELWNREQWQAEKAASREQAWQILESMERRE
ncbi:MAG: division/cell wall cluster transcriptional repressor MraZ [Chloroflexi bacterium]|nr:division/cell wall cluster transcriptional repressor MraZ [Chloroflexota bacterium]